ncbi:MAG: hypothetical protein WBA77_14070 [Microcoleaceae cyanobacterium]
MKPRQKSDFPPYTFTKKQQPRRWMLAMMLTGVIIFKAYPTFIQTLLKDSYSFLATSWTHVSQMATGFAGLPINPNQTESTSETVVTTQCLTESDCPTSLPSFTKPLPTAVSISNLPLSQRVPWEIQLTGFNSNFVQSQFRQSNASLPSQLVEAIRQDLTSRLKSSVETLNIVQATPRNWPDTCLGLADEREFCGQQIISGWRVVGVAENQTWVYRSDATGKLLRLESLAAATEVIPPSVVNAVFQQATQQFGLPDSTVKVRETQQNIWPDSCLGLAHRDEICTHTLVPGWQVTLSSGWEQWVYRTDDTGLNVVLDLAASTRDFGRLPVVYNRNDTLFSRATQHSIWDAIAHHSIPQTTYNTLIKHQGDGGALR